MTKLEKDLKKLENPKNVRFNDLLSICKRHFGKPKINGSHHKFKHNWKGNLIILVIVKDGKMVKEYQVTEVKRVLLRMKEGDHELF